MEVDYCIQLFSSNDSQHRSFRDVLRHDHYITAADNITDSKFMDDFSVNQLEEWLSVLLGRSRTQLKLRRSGSTTSITTVPSLSQFYVYTEFLKWVNAIQHNLKSKTEIELLNSLATSINILPLSCTVDDPEHQYRIMGIGLILSLELRPTIPNFMGVSGWISSHYEPLGVLSTQGLVRDLAIREPIAGVNLRQALTKYRLTYKSTLGMIVQIAAALFMGWSKLRLQFDILDRDSITLRKINSSEPLSILYGDYHIAATHVATFTDYDTASLSYQGVDYYKPGDKVELNQLLFDMGMITTGDVSQAIQDVYEYTIQSDTYDDDWLKNFMIHGMRHWTGMKEIITPLSLLVEQPVTAVTLSVMNNENQIEDIKKLIQDNLEELKVVKSWESFESRWNSIRKHLLYLLYVEDSHPSLPQFNKNIRRDIGAGLRQLLHNYLIFKFNHPKTTPLYIAIIQERMKKLGFKVM